MEAYDQYINSLPDGKEKLELKAAQSDKKLEKARTQAEKGILKKTRKERKSGLLQALTDRADCQKALIAYQKENKAGPQEVIASEAKQSQLVQEIKALTKELEESGTQVATEWDGTMSVTEFEAALDQASPDTSLLKRSYTEKASVEALVKFARLMLQVKDEAMAEKAYRAVLSKARKDSDEALSAVRFLFERYCNQGKFSEALNLAKENAYREDLNTRVQILFEALQIASDVDPRDVVSILSGICRERQGTSWFWPDRSC